MGTTPAGMLSFLQKATAELKVVEDTTNAYCGVLPPGLWGVGTQGEDPGPTLKGLNVEFRYELFLASQLLAFLPVIYFIHPTKAVPVSHLSGYNSPGLPQGGRGSKTWGHLEGRGGFRAIDAIDSQASSFLFLSILPLSFPPGISTHQHRQPRSY